MKIFAYCLISTPLILFSCQAIKAPIQLDIQRSEIGPTSTGPKPQNGIGPVSTGPKPKLSPSTEKVINYFNVLNKNPNQTSPGKSQVAFKQKPVARATFKPLSLRIKLELKDGSEKVVFTAPINSSGEYIYSETDLSAILKSIDVLKNELVDVDFEIFQGKDKLLQKIEDPIVSNCKNNPLFLPIDSKGIEDDLFEIEENEVEENETEENEAEENETEEVYYDAAGMRYVECPENEAEEKNDD